MGEIRWRCFPAKRCVQARGSQPLERMKDCQDKQGEESKSEERIEEFGDRWSFQRHS